MFCTNTTGSVLRRSCWMNFKHELNNTFPLFSSSLSLPILLNTNPIHIQSRSRAITSNSSNSPPLPHDSAVFQSNKTANTLSSSSSSSSYSSQNHTPKPKLSTQIKHTLKTYGVPAFVFHSSIYVTTLATMFISIQNIDIHVIQQALDSVTNTTGLTLPSVIPDEGEAQEGGEVAKWTTSLVSAYLITAATGPVRGMYNPST